MNSYREVQRWLFNLRGQSFSSGDYGSVVVVVVVVCDGGLGYQRSMKPMGHYEWCHHK